MGWKLEKKRKKGYNGIRVWSTDSPKTAHQPIRLLFDNRCTSAIPFWPTSFIVGVCSREEVSRTATDLQSDRLIDGLIVDGFLPSLVMLHSVVWALILEQCFHDGLEGSLFAFGWCCWWWRCEWVEEEKENTGEGRDYVVEFWRWEVRVKDDGLWWWWCWGAGAFAYQCHLCFQLAFWYWWELVSWSFWKDWLAQGKELFFLLFPPLPSISPSCSSSPTDWAIIWVPTFLRFDLPW